MTKKKRLFKIIIGIAILYLPTLGFAQWDRIYTNDKSNCALEAVNSDTVFVVGWYCAIKTFDGGQTWDSINYNCNNFKFSDVNFPTPSVGYIVGNSVILKTENYGNNWQQLELDSIAQIIEAEFISADTGGLLESRLKGRSLS